MFLLRNNHPFCQVKVYSFWPRLSDKVSDKYILFFDIVFLSEFYQSLGETVISDMVKYGQEKLMKTNYSQEELLRSISDAGIEEAFLIYSEKGGRASLESFSSQWKSLIERMVEGYTNLLGVSIAEEKYKRKNPFWDPRD